MAVGLEKCEITRDRKESKCHFGPNKKFRNRNDISVFMIFVKKKNNHVDLVNFFFFLIMVLKKNPRESQIN